MSKNIQVDRQAFIEAMSKVSGALLKVEAVNKALDSCNNKLEASWRGNSKRKYYEQYEKIAGSFAEYTDSLITVKLELESVLQNFIAEDLKLQMKISDNK
ncbi:MAG: hypothetical protein E7214_02435 [Clostridium sp.]|nr:hypothetical protein [Clostridium sp.]